MPRSSGRSGQVEPLAALAALVVLGTGLTLYAVAYDHALLTERDRNPAQPALTRMLAEVRPGAVVLPSRLESAAPASVPSGYTVHATLAASNRTWSVGPRPPAAAAETSRTVAVRVEPGQVEPGRLRVVVWR